jgi:alginate O-acetyltransferase complex protein AlgF
MPALPARPRAVLVLLAFFAAAGLPLRGGANDALYDPAPPEGAAFVRVLNAGASALSPVLGAREFGAVAPRELTAYRVVQGGEAAWSGAGPKASFAIAAGGFYTVVVGLGDSARLLKDDAADDRLKAQIALYNLAPGEAVSLKTADGKVPLLQDVPSGGTAARFVNGVKVDLAAFRGEEVSAALAGFQFERGNGYSFLVFPGSAGLELTWVQNTTTTR